MGSQTSNRLGLEWAASQLQVSKTSVRFGSSGTLVDESVDLDLATQCSKWYAFESYASFVSVDPRSKSDKKHNNFSLAKSQLLSLERHLCKNLELQNGYIKSIEDDIANGYVRKVPFTEVRTTHSLSQWYLPHHPVVNPNKPSKICRFCNAAALFAGNSLNEVLDPGPDLLSDLIGILIRFRLFQIGLSADIEAKFMQVVVPEHEQRFLRFVWREGQSSEIETFQYTRHIFRAKSSPICANFVV